MISNKGIKGVDKTKKTKSKKVKKVGSAFKFNAGVKV